MGKEKHRGKINEILDDLPDERFTNLCPDTIAKLAKVEEDLAEETDEVLCRGAVGRWIKRMLKAIDPSKR